MKGGRAMVIAMVRVMGGMPVGMANSMVQQVASTCSEPENEKQGNQDELFHSSLLSTLPLLLQAACQESLSYLTCLIILSYVTSNPHLTPTLGEQFPGFPGEPHPTHN